VRDFLHRLTHLFKLNERYTYTYVFREWDDERGTGCAMIGQRCSRCGVISDVRPIS
jgi:hypothetical protein